MAENDNVLGISGQMNISDIEEQLKKLTDDLNGIGIATNNLSERTTAALQKIADSSASAQKKQEQTVALLKQTMTEVGNLTQGLPEKIRVAQTELGNVGASIAKIKEAMANAKDSKAVAEYNQQLQSQQALFASIQKRVEDMRLAYDEANISVSNIANAISTANAVSNVNNAATTASAMAHGATAAAVTAESGAHVANAASISKESEATKEATQETSEFAKTTKGASAELATLDSHISQTQENITSLQQKLDTGKFSDEETSNLRDALSTQQKLLEELYQNRRDLLENAKLGRTDNENPVSDINESAKEGSTILKEYQERFAELQEKMKNISSLEDYKQLLTEISALYKEITEGDVNVQTKVNYISPLATEKGSQATEQELEAIKALKESPEYKEYEKYADELGELEKKVYELKTNAREAINNFSSNTSVEDKIKEIESQLDSLQQKRKELYSTFDKKYAGQDWTLPGVLNDKEQQQRGEITDSIGRRERALRQLRLTTDETSKAQTEADNASKKGIDTLNAELDKLIEKRKEILGGVPNWLASWNSAGIVSMDDGERQRLDEVNEAIRQKKEEIKEAKAEVERLNEIEKEQEKFNAYGEQQMSVSKLREEIAKTNEELTKQNAKLEELKGKEATKKNTEDMKKLGDQIEETTKKQQALKRELEGRSGISKGLANIKDFFKNIGDNIKGIKGSISQGIKAGGGGLPGIFTMLTSTKVLGWGAAIGVAAGTVKSLTEEAEKLRLAMGGLKPYIDEDALGQLRQSFIDTALAGSAQSTEDMAKAATHWVRYYEQIRKTPAAIQEVVNASRDLATLTGQTADKSAEALTKIAGQYHLNAYEAKNAVNVIVNATTKSTVSMTEMMSALQSTGQRAKQMGTSFKEMAAVIAMSSQNFPSASSAASSYLMVLQRLSRQTKDEYNPLVVGATKALENLNKAHLSGAQIQKMFGVRIANQARYFIQNASAIGNYANGLDNASGKNKALARATQTAEYNQKALKNAVAALAKTVNLNITPAITGFVMGLTVIIQKCANGWNAAKNFFSPFITWIGKVSDEFSKSAFGRLWMKVARFNVGVLTLGGSEVLHAGYEAMKKGNQQRQLDTRIDELYSYYRGKMPKASTKAVRNAVYNNLRSSQKRGNYGGFSVKELLDAVTNKVNANDVLSQSEIKGLDFKPSKDNHVDDTSTQAQKNKRDEQLAKERYKKEQENARLELQLANQLEQNEIDVMADGAAKQRRQSKLDHEKRLQQIKEQARQFLNANIASAETEYNNKNPKATQQGKGFYTLGLQNKVNLTDNQRTLIDAQLEDENIKWAKAEKDLEEQLIASHQSYTDKKLDIERKYQEDIQAIDDAIKEAQVRNDQEQVDALQRTRNQRTVDYGKEKMQTAFDELKNSPDYVAAFTDIDKASTETLNSLVARFEKVEEAAASSLNPQDAKTYFDTVNGLLDELISRDPVGMAKQLTEQLQGQQQALAAAEWKRDYIKDGHNVIKTFEVQTDDNGASKLVPIYYTLAEAEEEVATAGQAVAHSQSQIDKANKKALDKVQNLINAFNQLGNAIGGEAGQIIGLIGDIANFAVSSANAMMSVSATASNAVKAMEKASAILTIIAAAIAVIRKVGSMAKTTDDYYQKAADKQKKINDMRQSVEEYRMEVLKAQEAEKSWFSSTALGELKSAWVEHAKAVKDYYAEYYEPQEIYQNKRSGLSKWGLPILGAIVGAIVSIATYGAGTVAGVALAAAIAGAGAAVGAGATSVINGIAYKEGQTAAYNNLKIQTRHKSFWRSEKTEDLRTWVKEKYGVDLFDEKGLVDKNVAQKVLDKYGNKLVGETKETLEELIELREAYDEYKEELQQYVSDTYSPLVDKMSDAVWEWLANGKDALQQFKDSASSTFTDIGKEMIKQMLLRDVFDGFQDKLTDLYDQYAQKKVDDNELLEKMAAIVGATVSSFETNLPALEEFAEKYRDILSKYGFDVTGNTEQSASAKGVTSITYDQANYLVNLATARNITLEQGNQMRQLIQLDTTQLRVTTLQIQSDISVMRDIQEQGLTQITRIEANTRPISEILAVVNDIYRLQKDNL